MIRHQEQPHSSDVWILEHLYVTTVARNGNGLYAEIGIRVGLTHLLCEVIAQKDDRRHSHNPQQQHYVSDRRLTMSPHPHVSYLISARCYSTGSDGRWRKVKISLPSLEL